MCDCQKPQEVKEISLHFMMVCSRQLLDMTEIGWDRKGNLEKVGDKASEQVGHPSECLSKR